MAEPGPLDAEIAALPKISLDILELIRTCQAQNGLRHNDFSRYRSYCTRKLFRLRRGRLIRLSHGGGGAPRKGAPSKWRPLPLTPATAREPRHLQLLLFQAERAWAYAQELRQAQAVEARAVRGARAAARLRRAARWADALRALCASRGDARTQLEAEAYAAWMRGHVALESSAWGEAQAALELAQRVYGELGRVAARRVKELFAARAAEIEPSLKFVRYNLARRGARAGGAGGGAAAGGGGGGGGGALADAVAAALQESAGATADGASSVAWRGSVVPVRSEKLRGILGAVVERAAGLPGLLAAGSGPASEGEAAYLETLSKLDDAVRVCEADAARAGREGGQELLVADMKALASYARFLKLRCALERALAGARAAEGSLGAAEAGGGAGEEAPAPAPTPAAAAATPAAPPLTLTGAWARSPLHGALEGVRGASQASAGAAAGAVASLYARAVSVVDEMATLASEGGSGGGEEALGRVLRARRVALAAARAWHQSLAFLYGGRLGDAAALMGRAEARAGEALAAYTAVEGALGCALPAAPAAPGAGGAAATWGAAVAAAGAAGSDVARVRALGTAIAARRAAITAGGLLHSVAPAARLDAPVVALYAQGLKGTRPLVRAARAATLIERGVCGGGLYAAGALLEPALDGGGLRTPLEVGRNGAAPQHLPGLLPVPFKPVLFDLAGMEVMYNVDALHALAAAEGKAGGGGGGGGGGVMGWLSGSK